MMMMILMITGCCNSQHFVLCFCLSFCLFVVCVAVGFGGILLHLAARVYMPFVLVYVAICYILTLYRTYTVYTVRTHTYIYIYMVYTYTGIPCIYG